MRAFGLRGLNSADLLTHEHGFFLLEINPRPGATLDLYPSWRLFALHVAACNGRLPASPPRETGATASAIVYARVSVTLAAGFDWPVWTSDRQAPGVVVRPGEPLCSVQAAADDTDAAMAEVRQRGDAIIAAVEDTGCRSA